MDECVTPATEMISPEEAFALLGHDTRISIVQALWQFDNEPASFSELREAVAIADSGQFNYHLGELVGAFVRETDAGYQLNYAGRRIVGAILDGTYTKRASVESFDAGVDCAMCGTQLQAMYSESAFRVECPECEQLISRFDLPPGAVEGRSQTGLVDIASCWVRAKFFLIMNGICPNCAGTMDHSWNMDIEYQNHDFVLESECSKCMNSATSTGVWAFANHPAVVSFFYDHGVNVLDEWWHVQLFAGEGGTRVRSEEPWEGVVVFSIEGETLKLVVDDALRVIEENRV